MQMRASSVAMRGAGDRDSGAGRRRAGRKARRRANRGVSEAPSRQAGGARFRRGDDAGRVGGAAAAAAPGVFRHARPVAAAGKDAAPRQDHRHTGARRRGDREAAISRADRACTSPATSTGRRRRRESCRRSCTFAATPSAAATATRRPTRTTACGSRPTATSAWSWTPCSWARSRKTTTAPTASAAGGGIRPAIRRPASSAGTACGPSTTS